MTKSKALKIFEQIALRNGVSVTQVRTDIQETIDAAMANPDPSVRAEWKNFKFRGEKTTPEEFVSYLSKKAKAEKKHNSR